MGRIIDRIVLYSALGAGLYILFLNLSGLPVAALFMSIACCVPLIRHHSRRASGVHMTALEAQEILTRLAFGDDGEAQVQIEKLLKPAASHELCYLPRHPSAAISVSDVFSAWKRLQGRQHIILAAACHADARAKAFARSLRNPSVEIADAARLLPMIRRSDLPKPQHARGRALAGRLKRAILTLPGLRPWPKHLLYGFLLSAAYLLTGSAAYLFLGTASMFLAAAAWRLKRT